MLRQDNSLGMVAGASRYDSGTDIVSRYQKVFGDNYHLGVHGFVEFIPGHAFALRRKTWDDIGGFGNHTRNVCEDHALSANLRRAEYGLFIHGDISVRQVRKLSRHAHCRRLWIWLQEAIFANIRAGSPLQEQLGGLFIPPILQRLPTISTVKDPCLLYLELLCLVSHCLHTLKAVQLRFPELYNGRAVSENFIAALFFRMRAHTKVAALLRVDLIQLGFGEAVLAVGKSQNTSDAYTNWQPVLGIFDMWEEAGILHSLDQVVVSAFLTEDNSLTPDFSAYAGM
jgi:hypothetical protein